ncbi:MAG: hypothetical protein ACRDCW_02960 [Sarcina sp.]
MTLFGVALGAFLGMFILKILGLATFSWWIIFSGIILLIVLFIIGALIAEMDN